MEFPDVFTQFWSVEVVPDVVCTVTVPNGATCTISNAACGIESTKSDSGRVYLYIKVNDLEETMLVPFIMNSFESTILDLPFVGGDSFKLYSKGVPCNIYVSGYMPSGTMLDVDNPIPKSDPILMNQFDNRLQINLSVPPIDETATENTNVDETNQENSNPTPTENTE
ncbi:hypothetical protein TVAG_071380 [Trichomonas vaginalis G3]|uniref:Nucleoplasmin-like domain-containing protein n=1 Tax=Trichomonas vaginalis (strain ATCC PRA-98 / G3) TaxID=412133 RepID=A2D841_TRIV3|nr:nucleoplasmin core domain domain-containing protein [Trichomonas vaginalis G3]EAY23474.1 hypothetical protein TVAG_071380 [Trichomonas vaginalis G3]KAI5493891.1 nucleoplasmin core domain domain-containing protein [Trichomonas vaginalis G3]|eukprot:XP_001584460.1 hypothetical protein [Trichomonas vaginalis G3]